MRVYNKHHRNAPAEAVYIGRGSPWGNPFVIGKDGDRAAVIAKFEESARAQPDFVRRVQRALKGRDLVCFCAPAACHGDVLIKLVREAEEARQNLDNPQAQPAP